MYRASLNDEKESNLRRKIKLERDGRVLKRYQCIMMSHEGVQNVTIAKVLGINEDTVTNWVKLYLNFGLEQLSHLDFKGKRVSKLEEIKEEIKSHVETGLVPNMNELANWIKDNFSIEIETSWLGRWCKKNSIFLLKNQD